MQVANEVEVSAAALAIWKSVERWRFFRLTKIATPPKAATPAPIARNSFRGQVTTRANTLVRRTTHQPKSHRRAVGDSGLLRFQTNCCRMSKTAGSFADIAANAAARTASSLQRQLRTRMATLKIGVRSIAVAPCSRGRYNFVRFDAVGTAPVSVCSSNPDAPCVSVPQASTRCHDDMCNTAPNTATFVTEITEHWRSGPK
jgi:hypothetical protein